MRAKRPLDVAQHEASHVVVGASVGLRLRHATAARTGRTVDGCEEVGWTWFHEGGHRAAFALMYAAGLAWERSVGGLWRGTPDERLVREQLPGRGSVVACVRAADAMLRGLMSQHARVTRLLLERDLWPKDMAALTRGQRVR
jgi:hypothetical protein